MLYSFTFGILFLACAVAFFNGYALRWIKGWQSLPQAEQEQIRILPLCRNIGGMLALAAAAFFAAGLSPAFREGGFRWAMIGWLILSGLDVWFIGKSGRYQKKPPVQARK